MRRALIPLADGVEEMEAVIVIDTLRRAKWEVLAAATQGLQVTASRGVRLVADKPWDNVEPGSFDILVLPGGKEGVRRLCVDPRVLDAVRDFARTNRWIGAICAAPLVLQAAGILAGRRVTCHPAVGAEMTVTSRLNDRVVQDGRLITSQGPGTAFEFALAMIRLIESPEVANTVQAGLVL